VLKVVSIKKSKLFDLPVINNVDTLDTFWWLNPEYKTIYYYSFLSLEMMIPFARECTYDNKRNGIQSERFDLLRIGKIAFF